MSAISVKLARTRRAIASADKVKKGQSHAGREIIFSFNFRPRWGADKKKRLRVEELRLNLREKGSIDHCSIRERSENVNKEGLTFSEKESK